MSYDSYTVSSPLGGTALPAAQTAGRGPTAHPNHGHLDHLISAGIVTHLVTVEEKIDPMFVVAQMRELSEVTFVAAFKEGLIAFGCPHGLPEVLSKIARPAFVTSPVYGSGFGDEPHEVFDTISIQLAALQEDVIALQEATPEHPSAALEQHINDITTRIEQKIESDHLTLIAPVLEGLKSEINRATDPARDTRIDVLTTQVTDLSAQVRAPAASAEIAQLLEGFEGIKQVLRGDGADIPPIAEQKAAFNQVLAVLTMLVKRVEAVASESAKPSIGAETAQEIAELRTRVDQLAHGLAAERATDHKAQVKSQRLLQSIAATLEKQASQAGDTSHIELKLDQLNRQNNDIFQTLAAQQRLISDILNRPDPKLDLSEQQAELAQFSASFAASIDRLETSARELAAEARMPSPRVEEVLSAIENVPQATHNTLTQSVDLAALDKELSSLRTAVGNLPRTLGVDALDRKVSSLTRRADPAAALSAQQQHLTRFSGSIAGVTERIEAMAQTLAAVRYDRAEMDSLADTASRIEAKLIGMLMDGQGVEQDAGDPPSDTSTAGQASLDDRSELDSAAEKMILGSVRANPVSLAPRASNAGLRRQDN